MAPRHVLTIDGVAQTMDAGWSLSLTANGRNTLHAAVFSSSGAYIPALDDEVFLAEEVDIISSSVANPSVITTAEAHGLSTGDTIVIASHTGSSPSIDGTHAVTRISETIFSIPVNVTVGGTGGSFQHRIFGGTIETPEVSSGTGPGGGVAIRTAIDVPDFTTFTERRFVGEVLAAGTLKSMLTTLVANYLPDCTLHADQVDGPTLEQQAFDYLMLRDTLNSLSNISNGYTWEIDSLKRLRYTLPSTKPAPFNINNDVEGEPTIKPTRHEYANRITLRYSAAAVPATAYLIATANFANGNTVTIDGKVYTFQSTLTNSDGNVQLGGTAKASLENLSRAIKRTGTPGTHYASATTLHSSVSSLVSVYFGTLQGMKVIAKVAGSAGNSIAVSETGGASIYWRTVFGVDSTLDGGADQALTNLVMVEDTAAQATAGIWERVVDAPEILDEITAEATAAALLVGALLTPRTITYNTRGIGLRPGQQQTVVLSKYGLSSVFLITDVEGRHVEGSLVWYTITAVEDQYLLAASRWRDLYKQWLGGSGGNMQIGAVTLAQVPPFVSTGSNGNVSFGGSQIEWQQTTGGAWIDASSIRVMWDTAVRGTSGTVYVWLRARTGGVSVTARLRNKTDGTTVGTSAAVTNTSFEMKSFAVTLTTGNKEYGIEISPSASNEDVQMGSGYLE